MPKHDFLSPKAISNRIKARGLQKLRWYCQLCQKQCRDENGFKCHQTSASHRRQMELFGQNSGQIVSQYSHQFESDFMAHMRVCHPNTRISANRVYNEFIRDKEHIHMNSTRWLSLSGFIQYLGKKGLCKIEQTPKGWFIQLVKRDDETDVRRSKRRDRDAAEQQDDIRQIKEIEEQVKKATSDYPITPEDNEEVSRDLIRSDPEARISFSVHRDTAPTDAIADEKATKRQRLDVFTEEPATNNDDSQSRHPTETEPMSKLEMIHAGIKERQQTAAPGSWIRPGIVVKILSPGLRIHGYYKQKGVIKKVVESYIAEIEVISSGDIVRVDQAELETVLPAIGGKLLILKGPYRDGIARVIGIDVERFSVEVELQMGRERGRKEWFEYEAVSKIYN